MKHSASYSLKHSIRCCKIVHIKYSINKGISWIVPGCSPRRILHGIPRRISRDFPRSIQQSVALSLPGSILRDVPWSIPQSILWGAPWGLPQVVIRGFSQGVSRSITRKVPNPPTPTPVRDSPRHSAKLFLRCS